MFAVRSRNVFNGAVKSIVVITLSMASQYHLGVETLAMVDMDDF